MLVGKLLKHLDGTEVFFELAGLGGTNTLSFWPPESLSATPASDVAVAG